MTNIIIHLLTIFSVFCSILYFSAQLLGFSVEETKQTTASVMF